jgi:DnaJ-class molecular chaperone
MIPDEIRNLPDNPCNEKVYLKECPDCKGEGIFEESECCGAAIKWTDICSKCGEHTNETECETCGGTGEIEMTEDEIQDLEEIESENDYEANKSEL